MKYLKPCLLSAVLILLAQHMVLSYQGNENLSKDEIQIEYIGHASFKVHTNQETILLDPFADKVWIGYSFPKNLTADAIFSTHPHYDHDGGIFIKRTPYWQGKIDLYTDPGEYKVGDFQVRGIMGKHCDPYGKEFGQKNTIWKLKVAGLTIAHLGDNGPLTEENVKALKGVDILMVPIDAEYHILKKEELATVLKQIDPRVIIPMHYKIEELENRPGKPQDLGPIDPYLIGKTNVLRLNSNKHSFSKASLSTSQQIVVFQHSPLIKPE
ncbi:MAG: MBL fold metallo-hydrolase [Roseivirga sp.]|nr:MBL fold metallo-hydrolase [Roseivirga sp.]